MKVCILGDGLTTLVLAKALVNQGINVHLFSDLKIRKVNKNRTVGITRDNVKFFNENILNIQKLLWDINKIEIFTENLNQEKILNFENKKKLFSTIRNYELLSSLKKELNKNKLFKTKKIFNNFLQIQGNYNLIINCDYKNKISKKFFYKRIDKNYNSFAHTTIVKHDKIEDNNTAYQYFTKRGPLAFLPISKNETSIVYSVKGSKDVNLDYFIKKFNTKFRINKINKHSRFELKSISLRSYYHKNILAFGDLLHRVHPLAGQGFNMTIRDIKVLINLIKFSLDHGLGLDESICEKFEKKVKSRNYIFSNSIDLIYEFFNLESKIKNNILGKFVKHLGKNKIINKVFLNIANRGVQI